MDLPIEARFDVTEVADVAVSPDGRRVAFVTAEMDPEADERRSSVFVVPADASRDPHRLTRVDDASDPTWSPDGTRLGVLMAREEDVALTVGRDDDADGGDGDDADGDGMADVDDADGNDDADGDGGDDADGDGGDDAEGDGDDADGDGDPETQVWVYDLERGGDARQVTRFEEGAESFDWSPSGDRLVVAARDPTDDQREYLDDLDEGGPIVTERLQHKYDGAGFLDTVRTYLHVVEVSTRGTERLDCTGLPPSTGTASTGRQPAWGDRGIAFCGYDGDDGDDTYAHDVFLCDPAADERERLTDGDLACQLPEWSPGGDRLAFGGGDPENFYRPREAFVADLDADDGPVVSVSAGLDRTVSRGPIRWLDDDRLLAPIGDEGWTRLARFHVDGEPERVFDAQERSESILGFDCAGGTVALVRSAPGDGTDLYSLTVDELDADRNADLNADPNADTIADTNADTEADPYTDPKAATGVDTRTRLTALNDELLSECADLRSQRVSFAGANHDEVEAIAYFPPGFDPADPDPHPFVLYIHGGPMAYDQPRWTFRDQLFTDRGYVVLQVNYHGSTSYGRAFSESLKGAWNTLEVEDLLAATDWAVDAGWADPDRLFVTGFSQGGVNTAYVLTRTDRFAAAAAEHGVYDLRATFGTDDSHNWFEADMGLPWENPAAYDDASSIPDVDEISTPLLVTAGQEDWRCPPSQSEQLHVSVRKQGVLAKLVLYQDEHHAVTAPERAVHRLRALLAWFDEHDPTTD